jgi:hypothetical protein
MECSHIYHAAALCTWPALDLYTTHNMDNMKHARLPAHCRPYTFSRLGWGGAAITVGVVACEPRPCAPHCWPPALQSTAHAPSSASHPPAATSHHECNILSATLIPSVISRAIHAGAALYSSRMITQLKLAVPEAVLFGDIGHAAYGTLVSTKT